MKTTRLAFIALFALALHPSAQAQTTQLSNLGGDFSMGISQTVDSSNYAATSFVTGTSAFGKWSFASVDLMISEDFDTPHVGLPPFTVSIFGSQAGAPGSLLMTLTGNTDPSTTGTFNYAASGALLLEDSTEYWIVATAPNANTAGSQYFWLAVDGTTFTVQNAGFGINEGQSLAISFNQGANWSVSNAADSFGGYLGFAVNASAVPEPSLYVMVILGLTVIAYSGWRRKHAAPTA